MFVRVAWVKSNDRTKHVELVVECFWTRVRFPPPPPNTVQVVFIENPDSVRSRGFLFPILPIAAGAPLIQERIISFPAGSRGQSFIETIRFAGANRLLVDIDNLGQEVVNSISAEALQDAKAARSKSRAAAA